MCLGEIEQIRDQYNVDQNLKDYFRRIKRKTALLISVSCELGALAGEVEPDTQFQLKRFGYYVGMAFQITDDILDFTGTEKQLGKPAGSDLEQGNVTLPVFFAREDASFDAHFITVMEKEEIDRKDIEQLIDQIKELGAIERSKEIADQYLSKAFDAIAEVPDHRAKRSLEQIAAYIGKRNY
jgi:heptaprenyl diphosphate synthase